MEKAEVTELQLIAVMSAAFAVSNYGHMLDEDRLRRMVEYDRNMTSARYAVCELAGHLMENDDHEEMFTKEAEGWEEEITKDGLRAWITQWRGYGSMYDWMAIFSEKLP